jgi:hypothetical protein
MSQSPKPSSEGSENSTSLAGVIPMSRQRATRVDVRIAHEAMEVVLPTNQQIGPWQARAAHLLAVAEKLKTTGRHNPSIAAEVDLLLGTVETHQRGLTAKVRDLPADVATSTRLEDTSRALASIASVLARARELMASRANGSV